VDLHGIGVISPASRPARFPGFCVRSPDVTADDGARRPFRADGCDSQPPALTGVAGPVGRLGAARVQDMRAQLDVGVCRDLSDAQWTAAAGLLTSTSRSCRSWRWS
jgi:hypothetical protein